jgi:hypothetical protein
MTKMRWFVFAVVVAAPFLPADAAILRHHSGSTCLPLYGLVSRTYYDERGIANSDTVNALPIVCPSRFDHDGASCPAYTPNHVLTYLDGSNTDEFFCFMYKVTHAGSIFWGTNRWTCSAGQCPDATVSYTGKGTMDIPDLSIGCTEQSSGKHGFVCSLPKNGSPGTSFVTWYKMEL